jgi:hypothetical protein
LRHGILKQALWVKTHVLLVEGIPVMSGIFDPEWGKDTIGIAPAADQEVT